MEFEPEKFEQDEYVFRIRALLAEQPDGLDLSGIEDAVRKTPDRDGDLPNVSDATFRARLERALLWLAVHDGAEFADRDGGGKVLRVRRTTAVAGDAGDVSDAELDDYRAQVRAALEAAPVRRLTSGDLKRAVKQAREVSGKEWAPLVYADVLTAMQSHEGLKRDEDGYQLPA